MTIVSRFVFENFCRSMLFCFSVECLNNRIDDDLQCLCWLIQTKPPNLSIEVTTILIDLGTKKGIVFLLRYSAFQFDSSFFIDLHFLSEFIDSNSSNNSNEEKNVRRAKFIEMKTRFFLLVQRIIDESWWFESSISIDKEKRRE